MEKISLVMTVGYRVVHRILRITAVSAVVPDDTECPRVDKVPSTDQTISIVNTHSSNAATHITSIASIPELPTSQAQLDVALKRMIADPLDQFGKPRKFPDTELWYDFSDRIPIVVNGKCATKHAHFKECRIYESEITAVYNIEKHPNLVVRYHMHCDSHMSPIDTTVVDYWFLSQLAGTGLVPRVYYFSAAFDPHQWIVLQPGAHGKTRSIGRRSDKPSVRYMIMEKVGLSVLLYFKSRPSKHLGFVESIKLGGQMIMLLEKLHAYNFIHGDAHVGNFAIHHNKLLLIDFGHGRIINKDELSEAHEPCLQHYWYHPWLSPWEMQKYQASFRDDVYRVLQGIAICMYGQAYFQYLEYLYHPKDASPEQRLAMKQRFAAIKDTGALFEIPKPEDKHWYFLPGIVTSFSLVDKVPKNTLREVRRILATIMSTLLTVTIDAKPDYQQIKRGLAEILWIVAQCEDECEGGQGFAGSLSEAAYESMFHVDFNVIRH